MPPGTAAWWTASDGSGRRRLPGRLHVTADVICTRCGHRNPADSNFCSSCGSPLEQSGQDRPTNNFQLDALSGEHEIEIDLDDVPAGGCCWSGRVRTPVRSSPWTRTW